MTMTPIENFDTNCTVVMVYPSIVEQQKQHHVDVDDQQQQQYDISLSAFSEIFHEYLSDHSETETTTSTSDTESTSTSASIPTATTIKSKENFEHSKNNNNTNIKKHPDLRTNLNSNQLFGVQLEVNFLLLEAERRKLKVLQQELNLTLDECDKFARNKHNQNQCHELILAIS